MGNSLHKDAEHRRQAALPILAIAMAIAVVGVLPGDNFDLFIASTNSQFGTLAPAVWNFEFLILCWESLTCLFLLPLLRPLLPPLQVVAT